MTFTNMYQTLSAFSFHICCIFFTIQAKEMAQPFKYSDYRKQKIQEKIRETRANRVVIEKKVRHVLQIAACQLIFF